LSLIEVLKHFSDSFNFFNLAFDAPRIFHKNIERGYFMISCFAFLISFNSFL